MPEIFREQGFKVVIFYDDHEPAHVHVFKGSGQLRVQIKDASLLSVKGDISNKEIKKALKLIEANQATLLKIWNEIHG